MPPSATMPVVDPRACGTVRCEPAWSWRRQDFPDFDLWFVWAGRGRLTVDGRTHHLSRGSCFCLRPGNSVQGEHDSRDRLGVCYLHFDYLDGRRRRHRPAAAHLPPSHVQLPDPELVERLLRHAVSLAQSGDALGRRQAGVMIEVILLEMRRSLEAAAARDPTAASSPARRVQIDVVHAIARQIRENPAGPHAVGDVAARAGYTPDHLARLFRQILGTTPKEFCIRARIDRAKVLLRESAMSVEQVAGALGYADVFFFSRQFKRRTGLPPTAWRTCAAR